MFVSCFKAANVQQNRVKLSKEKNNNKKQDLRYKNGAKVTLPDPGEISLRSRQDLGEILGEFLAAKILRSRQDLKISAAINSPRILPRSWRDSLRDLKISANLGSQKLGEEILHVKSREISPVEISATSVTILEYLLYFHLFCQQN